MGFRMKPKTEFGIWMFKNMWEMDLCCADIARMLHTTRQTVNNHVCGKNPPSFVYIKAYCEIFGNKDDPEDIWKMVES